MLLYCKYHCEYFCIILLMFVLWSLVVRPNHVCSLHLTTDSVCNQRTTAVSASSLWGSQSKRLLSYFLQVIVLSSHFPPVHSVSHLSFTDRIPISVCPHPPIPCVSSRWLCTIMSLFTAQAQSYTMFSFMLRCIWLKMINVVFSWVYVNILWVILKRNGF